jgi:heme exporter protein C
MWNWFFRLASPPHVYVTAGTLTPWLLWPALALIAIGTYGGLVLAPSDYQQGDAFRIIYVHVPSAYLSTLIYVTMAVSAGIGLIWRIKLAHAVAASCAPVGASFTLVTLISGSVWGRPMWGTYWEWDPRLTAELVLLFLYLGYLGLRAAYEDISKADRASAVLAMVGIVNVPIIRFSVDWWSSIHQGPTISRLDAPAITGDMLWPLLTMIAGFTLFFLAVLAIRVRGEVLEREQHSRWALDMLRGTAQGRVD